MKKGKGGSSPMDRIYHKCHFCGGEVLEKRTTADYRWGDELIAVVKNVPAEVCQVCGEQYFKASFPSIRDPEPRVNLTLSRLFS